jgi:hypothetical protein
MLIHGGIQLVRNLAKLVDTYSGVRDWEYLIFKTQMTNVKGES